MKKMKPKYTYRQFTETNEWEGETWHFYIPIEGNEEAVAELEAQIKRCAEFATKHADVFDMTYQMSEKVFTSAEVKTLVDNSEEGYMNQHNRLEGKLTVPKLPVQVGKKAYERWWDDFYKGGIDDFIK